MGYRVNTLFTAGTTAVRIDRGPRALGELFLRFVCLKICFSIGDVSWLKIENKFEVVLFVVAVCVGRGRSPSRRVRGATAAAVQQQLFVSDTSPKIRISAAVCGSYRISRLTLLDLHPSPKRC